MTAAHAMYDVRVSSLGVIDMLSLRCEGCSFGIRGFGTIALSPAEIAKRLDQTLSLEWPKCCNFRDCKDRL